MHILGLAQSEAVIVTYKIWSWGSLYLKCTMTGTSQQAYKIKSLLVAIPNPCFKPAVQRRCNKARFWHVWWTVSCVSSSWRFGSLLGCPPLLLQPSLIPVYLTNPCSHLTSLLTPHSSEPFGKWAGWGEKLEGWHP